MSEDIKQEAVVEDFLDEDTEIPGQRYVLLSFLSPEKVLDKKELFFFHKFLHTYEVDWKLKNLEKYLVDVVKHVNDELDEHARTLEKAEQFDAAQLCRKNRLRVDDVMNTYQTFVQKSRNELTKTKINEAYDDYMYANKSKLEEEFYAVNQFHTSVRGLKVRGVFSNPKEAEVKAKKLQNKDKYHNIFMAEVGKWTPWDPNPSEVHDQEYNNDQLNSLMKKYKENEDSREKYFEERTKNSKQVFGAPTSSSSASNQFGNMFNSQGDLALQRKTQQPSVTIERVSDSSTTSASNEVVQPSS
jgi:hypothetical protein